ncbi:MAG TPA: cytochrome c biogenesis protein CcsA [Vicinamibacterales bacterium]|jgi:ABC-type transport system involved in cytochrome c biogenesis permease subunit|nr:cytochrome c biogenesis protein CcsA [Vicinamibacterales bacterium]
MNIVPLTLYACALVAYAWHFGKRSAVVGRSATTLLVAAALSHTFAIGMQTMEVGHVPVGGASSAISTFVWLLALSYLYVEMTTDERAMGVFILPLLVALQAIPALRPGVEDRAAVLQGPLFGVHVSSLLFAYASFALACVIGITYVLLFKEIKAKHLGFFYARLPSLQVLDGMNQRAIVIGWIFLTIGMIVGVIWAAQARGGYGAGDPRVQAISLEDPKIYVALLCWFVYSFELFAARRIGWGGRRAAYLSAVGFVIVLFNFVPITYFFSKSHNF